MVGNSEEINYGDRVGDAGEVKFEGYETSEVGNLENVELRSDGTKDKEIGDLGLASSASVEMKYQVSPSSLSMKKGFGLRKWKRLPRDASRRHDSNTETGNIVIEELGSSVLNPTKRGPVYAERHRKIDDAFSPPSPVVGRLDAFSLIDAGLTTGCHFDAGTSSQNGQVQNSSSSTAASVAKIDYEIPLVVGIANDKSRMVLSGKSSAHSLHRGQQGKGRIQAIKKLRGERVKIEKENSQSSLESDSCSSNVQTIYTTGNGTRAEVSTNHYGENDDDLQDSLKQVVDAPRHIDSQGGSHEILAEDEVTELSWEVNNGGFENHFSHVDQDPLAESISDLRAAQKALAKERLMIKELSIEAFTDDSVSGDHPCSPGLATQSLYRLTKETEDLFKKRMESEVIYLIISGKVQEVRSKYTAHTSMQTEIHDKLVMQKKETVESENLARVEETLKLQKRVYRYTTFSLVQLVLLVIIFVAVVFPSSPNLKIVPT